MSLLGRALLVTVVALACVGCDQTTKLAARAWLPATEVTSLLGDTVRLQLAANYGAFLGLGDELADAGQQWLLSMGVGCMLLALLFHVLLSKTLQSAVVLSLALMLGGGLSNLLDRLVHGGCVVDFINLGVGPLRTGIFNIADVAIALGVVLLLFSSRRAAANP